MPLDWTPALPTKPGWYWTTRGADRSIVVLALNDGTYGPDGERRRGKHLQVLASRVMDAGLYVGDSALLWLDVEAFAEDGRVWAGPIPEPLAAAVARGAP